MVANGNIAEKYSCWKLLITLKSDLCAGSGDSAAGLIDIKVVTRNGIPEIPAKRLKGCLLQEGKEMCDNGVIAQGVLEQLFGRQGGEIPGRLQIQDAHLQTVPKGILDDELHSLDYYEGLQKELDGSESQQMKAWLEERLTCTRTRTAIDEETGTAKDNTLRTMQVVPKGMIFQSRLKLWESGDPDENDTMRKALANCVKALRHLGVGITRGMGEVTCSLEEYSAEMQEALSKDLSNDLSEDMSHDLPENMSKNLPEALPEGAPAMGDIEDGQEVEEVYELELKAPLLFAGKNGLYEDCSDQIPGEALLGAFAGMVIQDGGMGRNAHENEEFRRIFLEDGVKFGYCFLKKGEQVFFPCPANLAREKEGNVSINLLKGGESIRRKEISAQVSDQFDGHRIVVADTEKEVRIHHARPLDRSIGHALNDWDGSKHDDMGQFYQYTCLSMGQKFEGAIRGKAEDIRLLRESLARRKNCFYLGRSKRAEYGEVVLHWKSRNVIGSDAPGGEEEKTDQWLLWFITPCVVMDEKNGDIAPDFNILTKQLKEKHKLSICGADKAFLKYVKVGGFNSRWGLPSPQYAAFGPGTAVKVKSEQPCSAAELEKIRLGQFTGKGYGQFKAIPYQKAEQLLGGCELEHMPDKKQNGSYRNPFLIHMVNARKNMEQNQLEKERAMEVFQKIFGHDTADKKMGLLNMSAVSWLIELLDLDKENMCAEKAISFECLETKITNGIKNQQKREKVLKYLKACYDSCETVSYVFLRAFLEYTKWEIRKEGQLNG